MCSNAKYVASTAVLILILCVLGTDQLLFSRKKSTMPPPLESFDGFAQQSAPVSQKATSHWWQLKSFRPFASESSNVDNNSAGSNSNQVAVAVPLVHQKLQSIIDNQVNSNVRWVPCLCPVRKDEHQQHNQQLHQQHQLHQQQQQQHQQPQQQQLQKQQPQQQQPQQQSQQQQYESSYYSPTANQVTGDTVDNSPRFIFANYPVEA